VHSLVLHERNERRNNYRCLPRNQRRQLIAERLASAGRHDHAGVIAAKQALNNPLLQRTKRRVAPIPLKRGYKLRAGHSPSIEAEWRRGAEKSVAVPRSEFW